MVQIKLSWILFCFEKKTRFPEKPASQSSHSKFLQVKQVNQVIPIFFKKKLDPQIQIGPDTL